MIEKDGKYSYINPEGKTVSESDGTVARTFLQYNTLSGPFSSACIADENASNAQGKNVFPDPQVIQGAPHCGMLHGTPAPFGYFVQDDGSVAIQPAYEISEGTVYKGEVPEQLFFAAHSPKDSFTPYIFNPKTEKLYGPYTEENPGAVSQRTNRPLDRRSFDDNSISGLYNYLIIGPFWSQEGEQFVLHSEDDEHQISDIDEVKLIDYTAAGGIKDSHLTVYDKNLTPIYSGSFESGAAPIGSVISVQIDGTWYLINTKPVDEEKSVSSDSAIQNAAGTCTICPDFGQKEIQFTIRDDGTFAVQVVTDSPNGFPSDDTYYQYDASGALTPKTAPDGSMQFTISNLKTSDYSDYNGKMREGRNLAYWMLLDLFNGRTILFYPAGTSWDQIDSVTREQLLRMDPPVTEGEPLKANVIRINASEITLMQDSAQ
ncbi:hypothetical protein [Allobaculum mucilyticum]|uniref:hypothetical protein n=1 Tax=Allobaculum mucilyticum TaxID=2834459 RepID=UPI001E4986A8|nr:hypothetical protein [Allobaculum mucilyticum]UNT96101.1 hypothetical protein KWG62_12600 [Allobaculum mucilyticum]